RQGVTPIPGDEVVSEEDSAVAEPVDAGVDSTMVTPPDEVDAGVLDAGTDTGDPNDSEAVPSPGSVDAALDVEVASAEGGDEEPCGCLNYDLFWTEAHYL